MTSPIAIACLAVLLLPACKKDGATPAFVQLGTPVVKDADGNTVSSKITDVWVYLDDQPVGVWPSGRRVPLIGAGNAALKVVAGVRNNGVTDDRIQYPFYATWQQNVDLVPGQTISITPEIHYYDDLNDWLADFETGDRFDTVNCTATLELVPSDSTLTGQGLRNGRINLDSAHPMYEGESSGDAFTLAQGANAFLEMDYRSDVQLEVGVRYMRAGVQKQTAYVYALPTGTAGDMPWNKIYIDMATPWDVSGAMDKRFYIKAELPAGASSATVDVDNIKLVHN